MPGCSYRLLLVSTLLVAFSSKAPAQAPDTSDFSAFRQVITPNVWIAAGATRLSDLFELAGGWRRVSVDGFTGTDLLASRLPAAEPQWVVVVDGVPVDLGGFGDLDLSLLPLDLRELARAEVVRGPVLAGGIFAPDGALFLTTKGPGAAPRLQGRMAYQNETGDPGPYLYTDRATTGVTRSLPISTATGVAGLGRARLRLGYKSSYDYETDELVRRRIEAAYGRRSRVRLLSVFARASCARHHLSLSTTGHEDFRFLAPLGREVLLHRRRLRAALRGALPAGLAYHASYTRETLGPDPDVTDALALQDPDWRQHRVRAGLQGTLRLATLTAHSGLLADVYHAETRYALASPTLVRAGVHTRLRLSPSPFGEASLAFYLGRAGTAWDLAALFETLVQEGLTYKIIGQLAASRTPAASTNDLWYWTTEGYAWLTEQETRLTVPPSISPEERLSARLAWEGSWAPALHFSVEGEAAYRRGTLVDAVVDYDDATTLFDVATTLAPEASGLMLAAAVSARYQPGARLYVRAFVHAAQAATGDEAFDEGANAAPDYQVGGAVLFRPIDRLSLYARLRHLGPTRWPGFALADAASEGRYPGRLPAQTALDLTASKWFWGDHLEVSVGVRNALDHALRTHPAGATTRITLQVQAALRLPE